MFSCEASRVDPSRRRDEIPIPSRQDNSPPRFHHLRLNSNCVEGLGNFPPIINSWESVHRGQGVRRGSAGSGARVGALRTRRRCEYVPSVLIHLCEAYGEEVSDFVALDKSAIFTIATASVQELDKQLQEEKNKVADLLARVVALESR